MDPTSVLLAAESSPSVQTGVIDAVGWVLALGGLLVTALWLWYLIR